VSAGLSRARGPLRTLRAALSVFRIQLREATQYRAAMMSGMTISVFWVLINLTVYIAFFTYGERVSLPGASGGMTLRDTVTYEWLAQFLIVIRFSTLSGVIAAQIEKGDIGVELLRPFPLYNMWFARNAAASVAQLPLRGGLILLVGLMMPAAYRWGPPASVPALACAVLSAALAVLLVTAFANFIAAVRMNVDWGNGPMSMAMLLGDVLSGGYLPLKLWPEFMQNFLLYQPFAGSIDIPIRLYLGFIAPGEAWFYCAVQIFWTLAFVALGRLLMRKRLKNIVVQGG
jgi:ABC-2 type transport system permease protein